MSVGIINPILRGLKFNPEATKVLTRTNKYVEVDLVKLSDFVDPKLYMGYLETGQINGFEIEQFKRDLIAQAQALRDKKVQTKLTAIKEITDNFIVVRDADKDPDQKKSLVLVGKTNFTIVSSNADQVLVPLKLKDKNAYSEIIMNAPLVRFIFDYSKPPGFTGEYVDEGLAELFNTFSPNDLSHIVADSWTKAHWAPRFFEHLYPKEDQRKQVFGWVLKARDGVNDTMLLHVGRHGNGKSSAMALFSSFHKQRYVMWDDSKRLDSVFNAHKENKRIAIYDEVIANDNKAKSAIKRMFSPKVMVEAKGVDAREGRLNCSVLAATNNEEDFHVEIGDRRISTPDLASDVLPRELGDFFVPLAHRIQKDELIPGDLEIIKAVQEYIIENAAQDFRSEVPIKGDTFKSMCEIHAPQVIYFCLNYLRDEQRAIMGEPLRYSDLKSDWDDKAATGRKHNFPSFAKLVSRLRTFLDKDETLEVDKKEKTLLLKKS